MSRRRKTIKPVDLSATVEKLLSEYGDDVYEVMGDAITLVSEQAVSDLHAVKKFSPKGHPTGKYSASWTYEERYPTRYSKESTVFNQSHYQLTHLLESGHAKYLWGRATGDRVEGYEHIRPVNEKTQETVIRKVEEGIKNL